MAERTTSSDSPRLPWRQDRAERIRFGVILALVLAAFLVPAALIPGLQLAEPDRAEIVPKPPRLAQLVAAPTPVEIELPEVPPPPAPEPKPKPKPKPKPVVTEPTATVAEPEPRPAPEPAVTEPRKQTTEQARETAARSGLFAMKDRLAALQAPAARPDKRSANLSDERAEMAPDSAERRLAGSGGVQTRAAPVREVELAQHDLSRVSAPQKPEPAVARNAPARSSIGARAMSNVRQVFDGQKSALYALYQRELRRDPTLAGKVTLELVIEPDGSVSACQVVSSGLGNPALEQRIAMRVQMFNFGAASVEARKVRFPIDFLPG
ncbi:MAG: AgmX/PglI C-terminal domain-containing protein [Marinobacter sp.]